jgi:hypothetical protein
MNVKMGRSLRRTPRFFVYRQIWRNYFAQMKMGPAKFSPGPQNTVMLVAIVIVVIPIPIGMPTTAVFVPPTMPLIPAAFPRFAQFVPRMLGLSAVPAMMFRGFVQSVVRLGDAALATIVVLGRRPGCSRKC